MPRPTKRSCLACLNKKRLIGLAGEFEVAVPQAEPKAAFVPAPPPTAASTGTRLHSPPPARPPTLSPTVYEWRNPSCKQGKR